mgnify:CR=1 FL=1
MTLTISIILVFVSFSHCRQLFLAMARLDRGLMSEPLMLVQAYWEWQRLPTDRDKFTW